VFNEQHLPCLLRDCVAYYNGERVHTKLRDAPAGLQRREAPNGGDGRVLITDKFPQTAY